jgi:phage terminase large subunit-like protein
MTNYEDIKKIVNDLYKFYRFFVASSFKENLPAKHVRVISQELMKIYRGDYQRLCVAQPPRTSKSSLITLTYPFWLIARNPKLNILIVNNSAGLSEKFGIQLRELFNKYGELFNVKLSDIKHSSTYLMFTDNEGKLHSGSIRLVGAGGSITGQDADYIILDDIYSGNEITPSLLRKKIEWFQLIVEQRMEKHSRMIILHTRWADNDLQGYLKRQDEEKPEKERIYKFLSFPAINPDGTCIWPERYNVEDFIKKREDVGERIFQAIYQQTPLDMSSDYFNISHLHFGKPQGFKETDSKSCRAWDIASSDIGKNDYTAGLKMYRYDKYAVIRDLVHGQFGSNNKKIIQQTAQMDTPATQIVIETGVAAAGKLLYEEWEKQLEGYIVKQAQVTGQGTKADRATPLQNAIEDGLVYIDIADDNKRGKLIDELSSFPNTAVNDDIVDATAHAYNHLFMNNQEKDKTAKLGVVFL